MKERKKGDIIIMFWAVAFILAFAVLTAE